MSDGFWDKKAGEWVAGATISIVAAAGVVWGILRKNRKRCENLIRFPDNWTAQRDVGRGTFTVTLTVEQFISDLPFSYIPHVYSEDTELDMESKLVPSSDTGRFSISLSAELDALPEVARDGRNVDASIRVTTDDGTTRTSSSRSIAITEINQE